MMVYPFTGQIIRFERMPFGHFSASLLDGKFAGTTDIQKLIPISVAKSSARNP